MSQREVEVYGAEILARRARKVKVVDERVRALIRDMIETMESKQGVGLAANQVGEPMSVIVVKTDGENEEVHAVVNPEVIYVEGTVAMEEGCLSLPGLFCEVERPEMIVIRGQEVLEDDVRDIEIQARDLDARIYLHEIDHLNGLLIIDRLNPKIRAITLARWLREREEDASRTET